MVSITAIFGIFIIIFAFIGAMRGWSKELLVTSALLLGLFVNTILENHIAMYQTMLLVQTPEAQFMIRSGAIALLAFFGYQTPQFRFLQPKMVRERLEEIMLGLVCGAVNGYFLFGSIWYYLEQAGYPTDFVTLPEAGSDLAVRIASTMAYLPPNILTPPLIYFAVGAVFIFVIVVFL
ncbi:MAG: hypothetical protein JXA25_08495 [Anaerolineales bacterium]|nr:hypothetical protein [Anaerolineales bacterium]